MNKKQRPVSSAKTAKKLLGYMALTALAAAWWFGYSQSYHFSDELKAHYPSASVASVAGQVFAFDVLGSNSAKRVYAAEAQGYGGPLSVMFTLDQYQKVRNLELLSHVDTPGYVVNVLHQRFLDRIEGKTISNSFVVGEDIDGISGATLTVVGITDAVRKAAHEEAFQRALHVNTVPVSWNLGITDALISLLIALVLFEKKLPAPMRQFHLLTVGVLSVAVIGYWANMALSVSSVSSFLLGYWPDPRQNPTIYLIIGTVLVGILWLGKNLYCSSLCPFHHIQRWANKLSGNNWPIPDVIKKHSVDITNALLWVSLMLIFLSRNPAISGFEPFSMLFSLDGVGVQWYILPLALFGSFFVKDFWCRLLCPLGRGINYTVAKRQSIKKSVASISESPRKRSV